MHTAPWNGRIYQHTLEWVLCRWYGKHITVYSDMSVTLSLATPLTLYVLTSRKDWSHERDRACQHQCGETTYQSQCPWYSLKPVLAKSPDLILLASMVVCVVTWMPGFVGVVGHLPRKAYIDVEYPSHEGRVSCFPLDFSSVYMKTQDKTRLISKHIENFYCFQNNKCMKMVISFII